MSIEINYRVPTIQAAALQVKESFKGTTPIRSKVIGAVREIYDVKGAELESIARRVWEGVKAVPNDSIDRLPPEVLKRIMGHAEAATLRSALLTSPDLNGIAKAVIAEGREAASAMAFGALQWKEFLGADVGQEPPLPVDIGKILTSKCPFSSDGRIVAETHLLMLMPVTINGEPLNFASLDRLFKSKFPEFGDQTIYPILDLPQNATVECDKSRWVLMTRDLIRGTRDKSYKRQASLLQEKGGGKYVFPPVLFASICILLEYARSNGRVCLFGESPWSFTRCEEAFDGSHVVVGSIGKKGLMVEIPPKHLNHALFGVAGMRLLLL
jgi:hypothetical protein